MEAPEDAVEAPTSEEDASGIDQIEMQEVATPQILKAPEAPEAAIQQLTGMNQSEPCSTDLLPRLSETLQLLSHLMSHTIPPLPPHLVRAVQSRECG